MIGDAIQLKLTITPSNATNQKTSWVSSDTSKATVNSSGKVTLKAIGEVTVSAIVDGVTAISNITINEKANNG